MAEKDVISKEKIKYSGLGDFKSAYEFAFGWLSGEGLSLSENSYSEKVKGETKDIEIAWSGSKKLTDYFKMVIDVKWRILGMSDVEVEIDGKRKKMNKFTDLSIEIKGTLVKDWESKWDGSPSHRVLKDIYHKYVIPSRVSQKEDQVSGTVKDFAEEMKAFFDLTGRR